VFASSDNAFRKRELQHHADPGTETYALMMAGLGVIGFVARRRRRG
jgi:MYXO-CTERM domain-containing protein